MKRFGLMPPRFVFSAMCGGRMIRAEDIKKMKQRIECETVGDPVFTVIFVANPSADHTALDIIGTIIRQNIDRNVGKISKDNKGRVCYLDTNGG